MFDFKILAFFSSALAIPFDGVFCVFFMMPCVATISVFFSVSQKAKRL